MLTSGTDTIEKHIGLRSRSHEGAETMVGEIPNELMAESARPRLVIVSPTLWRDPASK